MHRICIAIRRYRTGNVGSRQGDIPVVCAGTGVCDKRGLSALGTAQVSALSDAVLHDEGGAECDEFGVFEYVGVEACTGDWHYVDW